MPDEPGRAMLCSTLLESEQSRCQSSTSITALSRTRLQGDTPTLSRLPALARFPYEYERGNSPSTSTAAHCCANGSTTPRRRRRTSMRWLPDEQGWVRERAPYLSY